MKAWKRIEPTKVTKVGWRTVVSKTFVDNENQQHIFDTYCRDGQEMAGILGITTEGKVIIARQFRVGPEKIMEELPGGFVDPGEDKEVAARRELLEETGYEASTVEYVGACHKDTYMNATWHIFFATDCVKKAEQNLEHEEDIEIDLISIDRLFENARTDRMTDPIAVYWSQDKLKQIQASL
jgi:ADP-ribose pyrophosphatase